MIDSTTVFEYVKTAVLQNQFAQGGLVIGILTGIVMYGRKMLSAFKTWFLRKTTMKIEILSGEDAFNWCQLWLSQSKFGQKTQTLMVRNDGQGSCQLMPGTGRHVFFYKRRLFFLWNIVEPIRSDNMLVGYQRSVVIHIVPGNRRIGEEFVREAEQTYNAKYKSKIKVYAPDSWGGGWLSQGVVSKRDIDSVVLREQTKQTVLNDISDFKKNREQYQALNIPWRRGYLLYGKPGNGKSSLALAIASTFDYALYVLQLSGIGNDEKLRSVCSCVPENSVLLIEDVDCSHALEKRVVKREKQEYGITLSGMLNVLDGATSSEGRIIVMTTNHPDTLDPALIRPGRADCHIEISTPVPSQVIAMFERFYGPSNLSQQFADMMDYDNISMAKLQVHFLKYKTAQAAVDNWQEKQVVETAESLGLV